MDETQTQLMMSTQVEELKPEVVYPICIDCNKIQATFEPGTNKAQMLPPKQIVCKAKQILTSREYNMLLTISNV